ncbi:MAG: PASTA domain-containing protein [bacterium]
MKLWKFLLMLAGLTAAGGVLLLGANFLLLPFLVHGNEEVTMPDLTGLNPEQVQEILRPLGLEVEVARTTPHPSLAPGLVLDQTPAPEAMVRGGRIVRLVTSEGPPAGSLPDLRGLSAAQAQATLQRENFRLGRTVTLQKPGVTQPVVAYQDPPAGTVLTRGEKVDLVIAEPAPATVLRMPDLRGLPLYRARQVVTDAGLVLAPVDYVRTSDLEPNHILQQSPVPGTRVRQGDRLELVASSR